MNKTRPKQLSFRVSEEEYQQLQAEDFREWKEPTGVYPFLRAGEADREYGRYQGTYPGTETDREQPQSNSKAV